MSSPVPGHGLNSFYMNLRLLILLSAVTAFCSCKKDDATFNSDTKAPLAVEFDNIAGSADLQLQTGSYHNASGETFSVTKLRYYVSNFSFTADDGTEFIVPQDSSYFLIDESDVSTHAPVVRLPEGRYKTFTFTLGVDSLRSTMDISKRTGVLDPTGVGGDMYWGWNSGYIFFKMEGSSPVAESGFMYHIGGFGGITSPGINNLKRISLDLDARGEPQVKTGMAPNLHLLVDVLKMFAGSTSVSIAATPVVMFENYSTAVSDNLPGMFVHDHTEN